MAGGPGWSTFHMSANESILSNIEDEQRVFIVYFWWKLLSPLLRRRGVKHGSLVNLACAPLPPSSCNAQVVAFSHFLSIYLLANVFYLSFLRHNCFYAFFRIIFLYLGARVETGSCRAHSLTLSMPLSPPHKEYYLLCMHAAGSWRLEGLGRWERALEAVWTLA